MANIVRFTLVVEGKKYVFYKRVFWENNERKLREFCNQTPISPEYYAEGLKRFKESVK